MQQRSARLFVFFLRFLRSAKVVVLESVHFLSLSRRLPFTLSSPLPLRCILSEMNFALSRSAAPAAGSTAARRGSVVAFARASANGVAIKVRPFVSFLCAPLVLSLIAFCFLQVPTVRCVLLLRALWR